MHDTASHEVAVDLSNITHWADDEPVPDDWTRGIVVRGHGKFYAIESLDGADSVLATVKGSLKQVKSESDPVAVGDRVWISDAGNNEARIEKIAPRRSRLARPSRRSEVSEQIILANPDQAMFLFSVANPTPHLRLLDRFLILAELAELPAHVVANKIDLDASLANEGRPTSRQVFGLYESIYPVHYISTPQGAGLAELRDHLEGNITVLAGPSGVGKSSLVNALQTDQVLKTGVVSKSTDKGRHTTSTSEMIRLGPSTYIADTPGIKSLGTSHVYQSKLDWYFPEFRPFLDRCRYSNCTHVNEPGCAVRQAIDMDAISPERYDSYCRLRFP